MALGIAAPFFSAELGDDVIPCGTWAARVVKRGVPKVRWHQGAKSPRKIFVPWETLLHACSPDLAMVGAKRFPIPRPK